MKTDPYNSGPLLRDEKEILFIDDLARLFSVSANTLRRKKWREKMGIPVKKIGKKLCCSKMEIENWFRGIKVNA